MNQLVPLSLSINGVVHDIAVAPWRTLLEVLRESIGMTGAKRSCQEGQCGACTVLIDGKAVNSCLYLAVEAQGKPIETIEGLAKDGKLHFVYWAKTEPERQWYIRYDTATGKREIERESIFRLEAAQKPNDSGVFVANRKEPASRLYFVSTIDNRSRLSCLASDDNGHSWHEHARCEQAFPERVYSISAAREPTLAGAIVGTFTVVKGEPKTYQDDNSGRVYFFRIPTSPSAATAETHAGEGAAP